jgi:hypothetical protein
LIKRHKALSRGRGLGEGEIKLREKAYLNPLIPTFSLREKEQMSLY